MGDRRITFAAALVVVWPDGRFRVSSENGLEEWQAVDGTLLAGKEAAHEVLQARHLPSHGGLVQRLSLFPREEVASA